MVGVVCELSNASSIVKLFCVPFVCFHLLNFHILIISADMHS